VTPPSLPADYSDDVVGAVGGVGAGAEVVDVVEGVLG
jgi:hypothetical protein